MKKFLSLLLACLMILSLAACGGKDSGEKGDSSDSPTVRHPVSSAPVEDDSEPDKSSDDEAGKESEPVEQEDTEVTAESLVASGYGVGVPKSATLYFDFTVKEGSRSRTISCKHEYDGAYDHMVVTSQKNEDGTDVPMEYEFYYSYADSMAYQYSNGEVVSGTVDRFECGLTKVITVPVKTMMLDPVLVESDEWYSIEGKCPYQLFNSMLSFVYDDAAEFTSNVDFGLLYDKDTKMLTGLAWQATSGITEYQVWAYVDKLNSTKVDFGGSSSTSSGGGDSLSTESCRDNETLLAEVIYKKDFLYEDDISDVASKYAWVDDDILFQYRYFCNFYSKEGFLRQLANPSLDIEEEQKAAVIMCKTLGLQKELLWKNGYMPQDMAETYWSK